MSSEMLAVIEKAREIVDWENAKRAGDILSCHLCSGLRARSLGHGLIISPQIYSDTVTV